MANSTAMAAVQATVIALLGGDTTLTSLAPVYDAVPEGRYYPYIEISSIVETPNNTFGKNGRSLLLSISAFSDQAGFKESQAILERLNVLLDDTLMPDPAGWKCWMSAYESGTDQKEFDTVELRHLIAIYRIEVSQP
jgi:Protein of unknown function (DUF3168)